MKPKPLVYVGRVKPPVKAKQSLVVIPETLQAAAEKLIGGPAMVFVDSLIDNIEQFTISISNRVVATQQDAESVTNAVKQLQLADKKLEDKRKEVTGPIRAQEQTVNEWFRQFTSVLRAGVVDGQKSLQAYLVEQERQARAAALLEAKRKADELRAQAEAQLAVATDEETYPDQDSRDQALQDAAASENVAAAIEALPPTPKRAIARGGIGTSSLRKTWKARITDVSKLPQQILEAPKVTEALTAVLSAMAKQYKGQFNIPGAEAYEETGVGIR